MPAGESLSNKEIIDAAQDAVLNAADSVMNTIEATAGEIGGHGEVFYQSAEFWVAVSFVLVIVGLARPVGKILYAMLKKRGEAIAARIEEAAGLQEDAQKLLASYEKKYRQARQEAQEILNKSEREINLLKKDRLAKLESDMKNREREAKSRIGSAQEEAVAEIAAMTAGLTVKTVRKVLKQGLDAKAQDKLIDNSINLVASLSGTKR